MLIRDVLGIVAAMALFLFALQPQEHAHGGRRREADDVTDVQTASVSNQRPIREAEASEDELKHQPTGEIVNSLCKEMCASASSEFEWIGVSDDD